MNHELLDKIALQTGGSHFPAVFHHYQKDYVLNVLSEIQKVLHEVPFDAYAIDFWDDIIKHFQLDYYEIDKLLKSSKTGT
jgi:uncharacterized protein YihD (DUF1040 family)